MSIVAENNFPIIAFVKHLLGAHDGLAAIEAPHPAMQL